MAKKWITNNHTSDLEFELDAGGNQILKPGESAYIAIKNPDSADNQGQRHAGLYIMSDTKPGKEEVVPEAPTTTRPSTTEKSA